MRLNSKERRSEDSAAGNGSELRQVGSDDSRSFRTHRNRFFPRSRGVGRLGSADEGTALDDLEAGTRETGRDFDMPDIPEASGANTAEHSATSPADKEWSKQKGSNKDRAGEVLQAGSRTGPLGYTPEVSRERGSIDSGGRGRGRRGNTANPQGNDQGRIDPRSGIVSPQAVTSDSARDRGELPRKAETDLAKHR